MDKRILIAIFAFLILIAILILGSPLGLEVSEKTVESVMREDLFYNSSEYLPVYRGEIELQTIKIKNNSPFPKAHKLPDITACVGNERLYNTRYVGSLQPQDYGYGDVFPSGYQEIRVINVGPRKEESVKLVAYPEYNYDVFRGSASILTLTIYKDDSGSDPYSYTGCSDAASRISNKIEVPLK